MGLTTFSVPIRCFRVPGLIVCLPVCVTLTESPSVLPPVSTLDKSFFLSEPRILMNPTLLRPFVVGKFKFAGRQKILKSLKWGFTKYNREDYVRMRRSGELAADGNIVKVHNRRGPLKKSSLYLAGQD